MQMNFRKVRAALVSGMFLPAAVFAHPGHAPTNLAAQIAEPFAGMDHLLAFGALAGSLMCAFVLVLKARNARKPSASAARVAVRR